VDILPHDNVSQLSFKRSPEGDRNRLRDIPDADHFVRVPDGKYIAEFIGAVGFHYRGCFRKVALWFLIAEGDSKGERLPIYCNVESLDCRFGQRVRQPVFKVGWRADLTLYLATLFPDKYAPDKLPRVIPETEMAGHKIQIKTRTSKMTHKGRQRPEPFFYSVVDEILGWAE